MTSQRVDGFVGIKDKTDLKRSSWLLKDISINFTFYNYLILFKIFNYNGNDVITFPGKNNNELSEDDYYTKYEKDSIVVKIEVSRARMHKKYFEQRIEDIVKNAKQIPA
jgi:hypothetical protein